MVTFTTPGSNVRSNCPPFMHAISSTSTVALNAPIVTSGELTATVTPIATAASAHVAGISSASVSESVPSDMSRAHASLCDPTIAKSIVAIDPVPLTPSAPESLKSTLIVSASMNPQSTIGIAVPPISPLVTLVTFTTPGSNVRSNCPPFMHAISSTSTVALNAPIVTSGELTATVTPIDTSQSYQSAGVSFDIASTSIPLDRSRALVSPGAPTISKLIVAICPDPLTPVAFGRLNNTRIVPASVKFHESIGTSVPPISPAPTAVTFTTLGLNVSSNCPESRSVTSQISIVASNASDAISGALMQTCACCAIDSTMSESSELVVPS